MALLYRMGTGNGSGGDLKPFIINFTCDSGFIGKTVTMEFQGTPHAGETVDNVSGTVASDGTLTLYPMHDGLWKYYATSDLTGYQEGTITLEKWGNYPVELVDTINGATVTPTDDVQTWLHCANIWNKSYTTISEVVADTTTLNTLIANENANDYLVRSTAFATDICSNESAMIYIGLNDYCANKLLDNSTWLNAIGNSAYFEKVLNVKVPNLTSNTSFDGGEATADRNSSYAWKAFNSDESLIWEGGVGVRKAYIQYKFPYKVCIKKVTWVDAGNLRTGTYKIQGFNNDSNLIDLTGENTSTSITNFINIPENHKYYQYYRFQHVQSADNIVFASLQFYGRKEV